MKKYLKILNKHVGDAFRDMSALSSISFQSIFLVVLAVYDFRIGLMYAAGFILIEIIAYAIKVIWPTVRPDRQKYSNLLEKMDAGSFPSIHSARAIFMGATLLMVWDHILLTIVAVLIVLLVGASRIYLKRHHLRDVIGGYALGILLWILLTRIIL